jgi:anti-sigma factor RsiW
MSNCESAEALIVREADALLAQPEREQLDRHAESCAGCKGRREANLAVKAVLAGRVDADVPPAFAAGVVARTVSGMTPGWLTDIDWRRGTEWMVPVAAGLALLAVLAGNTPPSTSTETGTGTAVIESAGAVEDELAGASLPAQDMTSEELLAAMLGAVPGGSQGTSDGR